MAGATPPTSAATKPASASADVPIRQVGPARRPGLGPRLSSVVWARAPRVALRREATRARAMPVRAAVVPARCVVGVGVP